MPRRKKGGPPKIRVRKNLELTLQQAEFLERKVLELRRLAPKGKENKVSYTSVLQALVSLWMAQDQRKKPLWSTDK